MIVVFLRDVKSMMIVTQRIIVLPLLGIRVYLAGLNHVTNAIVASLDKE